MKLTAKEIKIREKYHKGDKLFRLSLRISNKFKENNSCIEYLSFNKKKLKEVDKLFKELFELLEKECKRNVAANEYFNNWITIANSKCAVMSYMEQMVDSLEYYSDRWCYERYYTIKKVWKMVRPHIKSWTDLP